MVRNIAKLMGLFLLATVLHWLFLALFGNWGISVNVMLIFMVAVCAYLKPAYGYPTAFICGLFLDFFGVKLFGHNAFVFTICAIMVYGLQRRLDFDSVISQMLCILGLGLISSVGNGLLLKIFVGFSGWNGWWAWLGGLCISTVIAPAVFWTVRRFFPKKIKSY